jgi:hypothetical protein
MNTQTQLFPLGQVVMTPGFLGLGLDPAPFLARHQSGDWGDNAQADSDENDFSVYNGFRIISSYRAPDGQPFWVITEADRSATTLLLPDEY